jgi:hypothetical protein
MLHTQAIEPGILDLIKSLQGKEYLKGFHLAGGTALALYYGHRISIDIDLFSDFSFDTSRLIESLQQDYALQLYYTAPNTIKGHIDDVNIDIIAHRYPYLREPSGIDGIRILSEPDILAMKLNAISVSGQRSKDFIDIYFVLERGYLMSEIMDFYRKKYSQEGDMHVIKALVYFHDVDLSDWPVLLRRTDLKWPEVKARIETEVKEYLRKGDE